MYLSLVLNDHSGCPLLYTKSAKWRCEWVVFVVVTWRAWWAGRARRSRATWWSGSAWARAARSRGTPSAPWWSSRGSATRSAPSPRCRRSTPAACRTASTGRTSRDPAITNKYNEVYSETTLVYKSECQNYMHMCADNILSFTGNNSPANAMWWNVVLMRENNTLAYQKAIKLNLKISLKLLSSHYNF